MTTFEVLDELMEITGATKSYNRMRFWFVQEIAAEEGFLKFLGDQCDDMRTRITKRRVLIGEMEALGARGEVLVETQAGIHEKKGHVARMDLND
ncbi:hypothetical protein Tco_1401392 [Tanacetum coccineum]